MQTHAPPCEAHQGYHKDRPRLVRSACLQSGWATEWFWQRWAVAIYSPCRRGEGGHLEFRWACGKVTLIIWTGAHSDWDFLNKPIGILTRHLWFSSQMPQNTQQQLCTFPTSRIEAAVRAHSGEEDVGGRCGLPVHRPGHGVGMPNPSPRPKLRWNWVWRSCLEMLSCLLLAGNRQ